MQAHHIKLSHICHRTFVSDDKLVDHMRDVQLAETVHSQEQMIEDKQAAEHAARQLFKEL